MTKLLGLNGEVLSDLDHNKKQMVEDALKEIEHLIKTVLPAMQQQAFVQRNMFGPFAYKVFEIEDYKIEYSFDEEEANPYVMAIFKGDSMFSEPFMELLFTKLAIHNNMARLEEMEQNK